ncbi:MAG: hypothetical protein E7231_00520 [Cellulosilyticum sp.]|nr:hypothetical protein [Cellulosilyticum sp.]
MQFCISITDPVALEKWLDIPKQKRSRYVEDMLLREGAQKSNIEELKSMLQEIVRNSSTNTFNVNLDSSVIDEILNL